MSDLNNEAIDGLESTAVPVEQEIEQPASIRDSLRAAMKPEEPKADRNRDEVGRFAKEPEKPTAAAKPETLGAPVAAPQEAKPVEPAPAQAATTRVPPGWSAEAKAKFGELPPEVQAAVTKREEEIDNGFRVLQDYKGLEEFTPLVRQAGTTHADVMRKAIGWEQALQRDPVNTVLNVAKMAGVNLHALVNGQPDQILERHPQPQQQQQPVDIEATIEHALRKRDTETQVQAFLADPANTHAEVVMDDMIALINAGRAKSLKDAYDAACWMRPDIRQQMISQSAPAPQDNQIAQRAAAADQARKASRSITGSSSPGPSKDAAPPQPTSIRDSLKSALAASAGRV
ncbi:hypothetical protein [Rhizobium sp. YTUHZ044]|uniref:hypothetical protein n=1 Tax=Rhizobium sp. YTUHZ044 TaxID=2962678 RepID=UPI003DA8808A